MTTDTFHSYVVHDLLGELPGVSSRAMFGGWGIYQDGVIFGIIADGELYLKADDSNRASFEALDSRPFVYTREGKQITMSYWFVPDVVLEDQDQLYALIEQSVAIERV